MLESSLIVDRRPAVIVPALNEAKKIGRALGETPCNPRAEVILVDEGPDDGTVLRMLW